MEWGIFWDLPGGAGEVGVTSLVQILDAANINSYV